VDPFDQIEMIGVPGGMATGQPEPGKEQAPPQVPTTPPGPLATPGQAPGR